MLQALLGSDELSAAEGREVWRWRNPLSFLGVLFFLPRYYAEDEKGDDNLMLD